MFAEGKYNVKLDGKLLFGMPREVDIPAGEHHLNIKVWNQATPPTLFVQGREVVTDGTWRVTNEDKEWIDESGKASDTSASVYMDAGSWNFRSPSEPPRILPSVRSPAVPCTVSAPKMAYYTTSGVRPSAIWCRKA